MNLLTFIVAIIVAVILISFGMTIYDVRKENAHKDNLVEKLFGNITITAVCAIFALLFVFITLVS